MRLWLCCISRITPEALWSRRGAWKGRAVAPFVGLVTRERSEQGPPPSSCPQRPAVHLRSELILQGVEGGLFFWRRSPQGALYRTPSSSTCRSRPLVEQSEEPGL